MVAGVAHPPFRSHTGGSRLAARHQPCGTRRGVGRDPGRHARRTGVAAAGANGL